MRFLKTLFAAAVLSFAFAPALVADDTCTPSIEASWNIAQRAYTPSDATNSAAAVVTSLGTKVQFQGGTFTAIEGTSPGLTVNYTVNTAAYPYTIDFQAYGVTFLQGIYKIDSDIMSLMVGLNGNRPTTFDIGDDRILLILKAIPQ